MDIRGRMVSAPTISPNRFGNCPRSGSAKRNQWNTGDGRSRGGILGATERSEALSARVNTARPAGLPAGGHTEANRRDSGGSWAGGGRDSKGNAEANSISTLDVFQRLVAG